MTDIASDMNQPPSDSAIVAAFRAIVGKGHVFAGDAVEQRYTKDPLDSHNSQPFLVVRPGDTSTLAEVIRITAQFGMSIVALGGLTNLVGGCVGGKNSIAVSLERLHRVIEIDRVNQTVTVEAGAVLQSVQEAVEAIGLFLPLDVGSRGSATIGGVISTNAGGLRVLRWGMARSMVMGLEVVTADGTIVSSLGKILKDNAGYDWKQLFIGTEGTLGIVTKAVLRLRPQPTSTNTALIAMNRDDQVSTMLRRLEHDLAGKLSSFELMWESFYSFMLDALSVKLAAPIPRGYRYYALVESLGSSPEHDQAEFEEALAKLLEDGSAETAVIAQSEKQRADLWSVREDISEAYSTLGPATGFDVGIALSRLNEFVDRSDRLIKDDYPDAIVLHYGHAGDGNLHVVVSIGTGDPDLIHDVETKIYGLVGEMNGSISAEHGIGLTKRAFIGLCRSPAELQLMARMKMALDPQSIFNPGKVLPDPL